MDDEYRVIILSCIVTIALLWFGTLFLEFSNFNLIINTVISLSVFIVWIISVILIINMYDN